MHYLPVYRLSLVRERSLPAGDRSITSAIDAAQILGEYLDGADREHFVILLLDTRNRVIGVNTVSIGTLNASMVHPREVFKPAILANAAAIIACHNHPSGDTTPSKEDMALTSRIKDAGALLGVPLLDHIIVGERQGYYSMKEWGVV